MKTIIILVLLFIFAPFVAAQENTWSQNATSPSLLLFAEGQIGQIRNPLVERARDYGRDWDLKLSALWEMPIAERANFLCKAGYGRQVVYWDSPGFLTHDIRNWSISFGAGFRFLLE